MQGQDQKDQSKYIFCSIRNHSIFLLLVLLFLLLFLLLLCNFVVAMTTKLHIKNNKTKKINLHTFSVQLSITQLRKQITGRCTSVRCTPSRGIWWPRLVVQQLILTFSGCSNATEKVSYSQMYPH